MIEFGYCDSERDVYRYQGAEYDTIRFDELTHFTETMYIYLISRLRGANDYPKQIKSGTNPGESAITGSRPGLSMWGRLESCTEPRRAAGFICPAGYRITAF